MKNSKLFFLLLAVSGCSAVLNFFIFNQPGTIQLPSGAVLSPAVVLPLSILLGAFVPFTWFFMCRSDWKGVTAEIFLRAYIVFSVVAFIMVGFFPGTTALLKLLKWLVPLAFFARELKKAIPATSLGGILFGAIVMQVAWLIALVVSLMASVAIGRLFL